MLNNVILYKKFLKFCIPWRKYAFISAVLIFFVALLQIPLPFLTKYIIDTIIPSQNLNVLIIITGGLFFLLLVRITSNAFCDILLFLFREKTLLNLQHKLFEHIEQLSMSFHNDKGVGYLLSRIGNDVSRLQGLMADNLLYTLQNIITFLTGVGALIFLNWRLALLSLTLMPFFVYSVYYFSIRIRKKSEHFYEVLAQLSGDLCEALYCLPLIKAFSLEKIQSQKILDGLNESYNAHFKVTKLSVASTIAITLISGLGPLLVLLVGGHEIMKGRLSIGGFIAFNSFLGYLYGPIQFIMGINIIFQSSIAALNRVFELFETPREDDEEKHCINLANSIKKIQFIDICFSYDNNNPAIEHANFSITAGEKIALAGRTGAGKTTLMSLLLKLYKPQSGCILINDIDISKIKSTILRTRIGIVQQSPIIFSRTIGDNIKIGNTKATVEDIYQAAKIANLHDYIQSLPLRYDTEVGERGVKLSGGQCQQLAIARVVLKRPDIIIFDEATSEIDSETESIIYRNLFHSSLTDAIFIFIAHRLFSLRHVDRIIFIENNRIVGTGNHNHLYENLMSYQSMCHEQAVETEQHNR